MTTKAKATATKELHIIARIQFKNDARKVCYQVKSSNGKDTYTTCLFQGKACSCTCPAKGLNCCHCTGCEKLEAKHREQEETARAYRELAYAEY